MPCREVDRFTVGAYAMTRRMDISPYVGRNNCAAVVNFPTIHPTSPTFIRPNFMYISDNEIKTLFLPHCKRALVKCSVWPIVRGLGWQRHHDPQRHIIIFLPALNPLYTTTKVSQRTPRLHIEAAKYLLCFLQSFVWCPTVGVGVKRSA